jgi:biotin carboxyl carrier protein
MTGDGSRVAHYLLRAATPGALLTIEVGTGTVVAEGDVVARLEIMKTEVPVESPVAGRIAAIHVALGGVVADGDLLMTIDVG